MRRQPFAFAGDADYPFFRTTGTSRRTTDMAERPDPPPTQQRTEIFHSAAEARNARIGLWLFAAYVLMYGGFMVLNAFFPQRMGVPFLAGVNLAVTYGLLLIVGAFLLALLYMFLVRGRNDGEVR
jgi:uncharacterized membrane protein (DUF485 family)